MLTNVRESSLAAYDSLKANGLTSSQQSILNHMQPGRIYSRKEIARALDMETSSVSGRVNELVADKRIEECGPIKCPISGKTVGGIKLPAEQKELF